MLLAAVGVAWAQGGVEVAAVVEPAQVTVGDVFELRVSVRAAEGTTVGEVGPEGKLAPARSRGSRLEAADGAQVRVLRLALYEVGERSLEGLKISYRLPGAARDETAAVPPCKVRVVSVVPANSTDILDIRPPVPPGATLPRWVLLAAAALVVLLALGLAAAALVRRLRKRERRPRATPEAVLEAHGVALRELDELAAGIRGGRLELAEARAHLSLVLRRLMEARLDIGATRMTTETLARAVRRSAAEGALPGLVEVLRQDDLARFSGVEDRAKAALGDVEWATELVRELAAEARSVAKVAEAGPEGHTAEVAEAGSLDGLPPVVSGLGGAGMLGERRGAADGVGADEAEPGGEPPQ